MQESACRALAALAASGDGGRARVVAMGGHNAALAALRAHRESAGVAQVACSVLRQLVSGAANVEHARCMGDAGAVETILDACMEHREVAGCCEQACGALRRLVPPPAPPNPPQSCSRAE